LYVEEGAEIAAEFYLSALVDRETSRVAFVVSTEGGMNIEEVAHDSPEKITTFSIDPATGAMPHHGRRAAQALGLTGDLAKQAEDLIGKLYRAFVEQDMSLLEINPLIVTKDGKLVCLDAKVSFDSNALYRHPDAAALRDPTEEDEKELEASKYDLNYIALDGTIGCMVNGAGLAMATMDIIKLYGAEPANFLDVGGGASKEKVTAAFKIITADPNVRGILVNIFGGIMRCDVIAEGVVAAVREVGLQVPLVVRLEGTNVDEGKQIIAQSGLNVIAADDLDDAAQKIVNAVNGTKG
jgi:succinyl-CoA synthetase beta subunit